MSFSNGQEGMQKGVALYKQFQLFLSEDTRKINILPNYLIRETGQKCKHIIPTELYEIIIKAKQEDLHVIKVYTFIESTLPDPSMMLATKTD